MRETALHVRGIYCAIAQLVLSLHFDCAAMKKRGLIPLMILVLLLALPEAGLAQRNVRQAAREDYRDDDPKGEPTGIWMGYKIEDGDTVFLDKIGPIWIFPKGRKGQKQLRQYYKLVYNFNKVYPYALVAKKIFSQAEADIEGDELKGGKRDRYVDRTQKELFNVFEKPLRKMTYSQGKLLVRLVDREIGKSPYEIIKYYKSGMAAGFWQGVAKLFDNDLKKRYDPAHSEDDAVVESLVQKWESGEFPALYYSIFCEDPPQVSIPSKYR